MRDGVSAVASSTCAPSLRAGVGWWEVTAPPPRARPPKPCFFFFIFRARDRWPLGPEQTPLRRPHFLLSFRLPPLFSLHPNPQPRRHPGHGLHHRPGRPGRHGPEPGPQRGGEGLPHLGLQPVGRQDGRGRRARAERRCAREKGWRDALCARWAWVARNAWTQALALLGQRSGRARPRLAWREGRCTPGGRDGACAFVAHPFLSSPSFPGLANLRGFKDLKDFVLSLEKPR